MITKIKNLKRKSIFITGVFALAAGFSLMFVAPAASAACTRDPVGHCSGYGYFTNVGPQTSNLGQVIVDGFTSSSYNPGTRGYITQVSFDPTNPNVVNKSSFISFIEGNISGGGRDAAGGQFIVQLMRGGTDFGRPSSSDITDWENRINNPDIEIVYSGNENWGNWNSGYMKDYPGYNDDAFINESGSSPALVFMSKSSKKVYFMLKTTCANPIGNMPGLPVAAHWDLSGSSEVAASTAAGAPRATSITASPGQTVAFYHAVYNSRYSTTATTVVSPSSDYNGAISPLAKKTLVIAAQTTEAYQINFAIPTNAVDGEKYCQRMYFSNATGPGTSDSAYTAYACVTVVATTFDGVKIDDSKTGAYGGGCATAVRSASSCVGTLAQYPFSDDGVTVNGTAAAGMTANFFDDNSIPVGSHTISVAPDANNGYWRVVGYSFCDSSAVSDCSSATMGYGDKYFKATTATTTPAITFVANHHYHMRWVYRYPGSFTVTGSASGSGFNDPESPVILNSTGTATIHFKYSNPASVAPLVTISYTVDYTLVHADGTSSAYPQPCSGTSGTFTVTGPKSTATITHGVTSSCTASMPPLVAGDHACVVYKFTPATGIIDPATGAVSDMTGIAPGQTCFGALANEPYAHFFGLDVSAGGTFASGLGDQCPTASSAAPGDIQMFVKTGAPLAPARGSSGQFAAFANGSGTVAGYSSASLRTATPKSPNGLTFANFNTLGHLGTIHCVPDYFATKTTTVTSSASTINLASYNGNGTSTAEEQTAYTAPSGVTVKSGGLGIAKGNRVAIYVTGNVYIHDDIKFKQTNWASVDEIPSFYLIVKGNIYIDPSVTQLDGVYVAQPDSGGGGGTIYTCAPGSPAVSTLFSNIDLYNKCQNQLTVNGAFVANTVNLLRTANSWRNSLGGEWPKPGVPENCSVSPDNGTRTSAMSNYDCAAEIFNFSPEVYLGHPGFDPIGGPAIGGKYDYITSLSPVL